MDGLGVEEVDILSSSFDLLDDQSLVPHEPQVMDLSIVLVAHLFKLRG